MYKVYVWNVNDRLLTDYPWKNIIRHDLIARITESRCTVDHHHHHHHHHRVACPMDQLVAVEPYELACMLQLHACRFCAGQRGSWWATETTELYILLTETMDMIAVRRRYRFHHVTHMKWRLHYVVDRQRSVGVVVGLRSSFMLLTWQNERLSEILRHKAGRPSNVLYCGLSVCLSVYLCKYTISFSPFKRIPYHCVEVVNRMMD